MVLSRRLRALAFAALSALLLFLSQEPVGLAPLAWLALIPLYVAIFGERRPRWSALYGLFAGLAFFGAHLSWIFLFGWMAWVGLALVMSAYWAGAAFVAGLARRLPLAPLLAAGGWAGFELLRDRAPFGGFPWGAVGTSQAGFPGVRWLAGSVGVYGLSFLAAFAAALIADRIVNRRWAYGSLALVAVAAVAFAMVDVVRYAPDVQGEPVRVALVQGDVPRPARPDQRARILESHLELTRRIPSGSVDVVVWPEDAIGIDAPPDAFTRVRELASEMGVPILVGHSQARPAEGTFVNAVAQVTADGDIADVYEKQHPVPFGEYVPLAFLRGAVTTLDQVPYDLARGDRPEVFDVAGIPVATPICFESVFPRDMRAFARLGAELQIVVTNDSSFERSYASAQHLAHARMRALELRQWTAQAALSGMSAVVAPDGTVSHRTELFEPAVVRTTMHARAASSLYARVGDLFPFAWALGTAAALLLWWGVMGWGRLQERREEVHAGASRSAEEPAPLR